MDRAPVRQLLVEYREAHPAEQEVADRFLAFVDAHPDVLHRTCLAGHVTASCWILNPEGTECLLTHHRKLGRWLQLGGHVDGNANLLAGAVREVQEESGILELHVHPVPVDLDIHPIPARGDEPAHLHLDVRYLLRAPKGAREIVSEESHALGWFSPTELAEIDTDESVQRLFRVAFGL